MNACSHPGIVRGSTKTLLVKVSGNRNTRPTTLKTHGYGHVYAVDGSGLAEQLDQAGRLDGQLGLCSHRSPAF